LGKFLTAAISIIVIKILTNYLGRAGFGEYITVYEFLAFFAIAADFGIFQIAVREITNNPKQRAKIFSNILSIRAIFSIIAMCAAIIAVFCIPKYTDTNIPIGVVIAAITTFLDLIFGTISSLLQIEMKMERTVLALVLGKLVALAWMSIIIFYWLPQNPAMGFFQILIAGIFGNSLQLIIIWLTARKLEKIFFGFDFDFWKKVLLKTLPYGAAILLATIYFRIDVILLSLLLPKKIANEQVGLYGVAMRIVENLQMISIFFLNSALPTFTRFFRDSKKKIRNSLQMAFDFLLLVGLPIVSGGIVLAYPIIALVAAPEFLSDFKINFLGSDVALQILLAAMLIAFLGNLFGYILLAAGRQIKLLWVSGIAVIFNLISNFFVIPQFGFRGAALTSVVSEILVCVLGFYFVYQFIKMRFQLKIFGKAMLSAIIMAAVVKSLEPVFFNFFGGNKSLLILIPVGGLVYLGGLILLRAVPKETLKLIWKR
jgi:O-antigen/teichoic acid export membrane protein